MVGSEMVLPFSCGIRVVAIAPAFQAGIRGFESHIPLYRKTYMISINISGVTGSGKTTLSKNNATLL